MSAYFYFMMQNRQEVKDKNPEAGIGGIAKILGKRWKEMTEKEKEPYHKMNKEKKEEYKLAMENYVIFQCCT